MMYMATSFTFLFHSCNSESDLTSRTSTTSIQVLEVLLSIDAQQVVASVKVTTEACASSMHPPTVVDESVHLYHLHRLELLFSLYPMWLPLMLYLMSLMLTFLMLYLMSLMSYLMSLMLYLILGFVVFIDLS